jgi:predicted nucleotidyltransferase
MQANLSKYIIDTIAYYDVMEYPMTSFEIWKYLNKKTEDTESLDNIPVCTLRDVQEKLEDKAVAELVEEYQGYFFLRGRKDLVAVRLERNKLANEKFKILRKVIWWLRFVPFVRMVAVTGSMAMKNTEESSDIDVLVVLKQGKIFTGRLLVTIMVHLLGKRRYANKIQNRICLNYFITTQSLEVFLKDLFSASEYSFIIPVFGFRFFRKFQEHNQWIRLYKPNGCNNLLTSLVALKDNSMARFIRRIGEKAFKFEYIENSLKEWQLKRIEADPRTHQDGSMVVADSEMLIFLPNPQGPGVFERFKNVSASILDKS